MSTVKERLLQFLKEERISASEFARRMGLSSAYIASMRKSMPEEKVEKLCQLYPQLNRDWLLYGEGEMYREDLQQKGLDPYHLHKHLIPLLPTQAAGGSFPMIAESIGRQDCQQVYCNFPGADYAIMIKGNSMEPEIQSGTMVVIKKINDKAFVPWGVPLVLDTQNGSVCKMLFPSNKGENYFEARSFNPDYPPFQIPVDSVYGIYRILGEIKAGWTF